MTADLGSRTTDAVATLREGRLPVVLLLPVGATEAHGPHAPLATDTLISSRVCALTAERLAAADVARALVLPPLPYGVTRFASGFAGTIGVREATLHDLVVDVLASAAADGFIRSAIVNNHFEPAHVATLQRAIDTLEARGCAVAYVDLTRRANAERLSAEFRSGACHAGRYETSLVLASDPELVDDERRAGLPPLPIDMPRAMGAGAESFAALGMAAAYCGAPADATAAEGRLLAGTLADLQVEAITALIAGTGGRDRPRGKAAPC